LMVRVLSVAPGLSSEHPRNTLGDGERCEEPRRDHGGDYRRSPPLYRRFRGRLRSRLDLATHRAGDIGSRVPRVKLVMRVLIVTDAFPDVFRRSRSLLPGSKSTARFPRSLVVSVRPAGLVR